MQLLINEVLQKVSNAKTKSTKIKLLQEYNTPALRQILIANFDESVISMLPDGEVPYKAKKMHQKIQSIPNLHTSIVNSIYSLKVEQMFLKLVRETLFIQLLEGLHKKRQRFYVL